MKRQSMYDMTYGSPLKLLLGFTIPLLIGNLFQQFYNMVDSIVVGQYVGANALASVGAAGSINFLFFSLSQGLSIGIGIIVSQCYGAKDQEQLQKTIANSIWLLTVSSLVMGLLGAFLARPIMQILRTPEEIIDDSVIYMQVSCLGLIAVAAYNGISSILRALGDSKTPLLFLIVASILNVVLDLLFVVGFHWEVFGVAFATIIAQFISACGCILYAYIKISYFRMPCIYFRPNRELIKRCCTLGVPVALQNAMIALSCVILQSVVNEFGAVVVAAFTANGRFEQLVHQPFSSLGAAVATFTGQNIGAGDIARVKKGYHTSTLICAVFSLIMIPVSFFGGSYIMSIFVNDPDVIRIGAMGIRITGFFYFPLGMIYVTRNLLNGAGDANYAMINGFMEVVGRVGLAKPLTMLSFIGVWGIWWTTALTWTLTAVVSFFRYLGGKWQLMSVVSSNQASADAISSTENLGKKSLFHKAK